MKRFVERELTMLMVDVGTANYASVLAKSLSERLPPPWAHLAFSATKNNVGLD